MIVWLRSTLVVVNIENEGGSTSPEISVQLLLNDPSKLSNFANFANIPPAQTLKPD